MSNNVSVYDAGLGAGEYVPTNVPVAGMENPVAQSTVVGVTRRAKWQPSGSSQVFVQNNTIKIEMTSQDALDGRSAYLVAKLKPENGILESSASWIQRLKVAVNGVEMCDIDEFASLYDAMIANEMSQDNHHYDFREMLPFDWKYSRTPQNASLLKGATDTATPALTAATDPASQGAAIRNFGIVNSITANNDPHSVAYRLAYATAATANYGGAQTAEQHIVIPLGFFCSLFRNSRHLPLSILKKINIEINLASNTRAMLGGATAKYEVSDISVYGDVYQYSATYNEYLMMASQLDESAEGFSYVLNDWTHTSNTVAVSTSYPSLSPQFSVAGANLRRLLFKVVPADNRSSSTDVKSTYGFYALNRSDAGLNLNMNGKKHFEYDLTNEKEVFVECHKKPLNDLQDIYNQLGAGSTLYLCGDQYGANIRKHGTFNLQFNLELNPTDDIISDGFDTSLSGNVNLKGKWATPAGVAITYDFLLWYQSTKVLKINNGALRLIQ